MTPRASLARRLASLAYEALSFAAIVIVAGFLTVPLTPLAGSGGAPRIPDLPARSASFLLIFATGGLYFGWSWSAGRRTLAMKTWRIGLERSDGGVVDRRKALVRYLAAWIGPAITLAAYVALRPLGYGPLAAALLALNFAWALGDPDGQFLHDRIAGTRLVVLTPSERSQRARSA